MNDFGLAVFFGLLFGFLFGAGASLAFIHAAYRRGYRKAAADSLEPVKPRAFKIEIEALRKKRAVAAAARAAQLGVEFADQQRPSLPPPEE